MINRMRIKIANNLSENSCPVKFGKYANSMRELDLERSESVSKAFGALAGTVVANITTFCFSKAGLDVVDDRVKYRSCE